MKDFNNFLEDLSVFCNGNTELVSKAMGNVFAFIDINAHGAIAEIAFEMFINKHMSDKYTAEYVGKDNAKKKNGKTEDIEITRLADQAKIPISLKTYNSGGFQLFPDTDKAFFNYFNQFEHLIERGQPDCSEIDIVSSKEDIDALFDLPAFKQFSEINTLIFIYGRNGHKVKNQYNDFRFVTFDSDKMRKNLTAIKLRTHAKNNEDKKLKTPLFNFYDKDGVVSCHYCFGGRGQEHGLYSFATNNHISDGKPKSNIYWKDVLNGTEKYSTQISLRDIIGPLI